MSDKPEEQQLQPNSTNNSKIKFDQVDWLRWFENKIEKTTKDENGDQNFIKKDEDKLKEPKDYQNKSGEALEGKTQKLNIFKKLKNLIFPLTNQQRNLSSETGGLEQEEQKEIHSVDAWDGRSEEILKVGKIDPLGSTGKKSMIWRIKKTKAEEKKLAKEVGAVVAEMKKNKKLTKHQEAAQGEEGAYDSRLDYSKQSFTTKVSNLKKLRQDQQNEGGRSHVI